MFTQIYKTRFYYDFRGIRGCLETLNISLVYKNNYNKIV